MLWCSRTVGCFLGCYKNFFRFLWFYKLPNLFFAKVLRPSADCVSDSILILAFSIRGEQGVCLSFGLFNVITASVFRSTILYKSG